MFNRKLRIITYILVAILTISAIFFGIRAGEEITGTFKIIERINLMQTPENQQTMEFLNEKKQLDCKYAEKIKKVIDLAKEELLKKRNQILGENFVELKSEMANLKAQIELERKKFFAGNDYTNAQETLSKIQRQIANTADENEKALFESDLKDAIQKIETLNVKCNNVLKSKTDELRLCERDITAIICKHKKQLDDTKTQLFITSKKQLSHIVMDYNAKLKGLKLKYSIEPSENLEFPMSESEISLYNSDEI